MTSLLERSKRKTGKRAVPRDCNDALALVLTIGAGTAAQDITISLQQATSAAGAGAKPLKFKEAWYKRGVPTFTPANAATQDKWVKSILASRDVPIFNGQYITAADRVSATNLFIALIRISPKDLDTGYPYVGAILSSPAASQWASGLWVPLGNAASGSSIPSLLS